jgi:hypothetical protein
MILPFTDSPRCFAEQPERANLKMKSRGPWKAGPRCSAYISFFRRTHVVIAR